MKHIQGDETVQVHLLGTSHKTAPVEIREKFSLDEQGMKDFFACTGRYNIQEIVYLSTCNRVEIYYANNDVPCDTEGLICLLEDFFGIEWQDFKSSFYRKNGRDAVYHLLSVASSLDSMVVGENEIFGQMKDAYRTAVESNRTGPLLNRLFHHAFNSSKKVRTQTEISKNPLSIAYIAVEQAKKVFDDLATKKTMLVGAGEMGELILKYFTKSDVKDITVANRSLCNAERIVEEINRDARIISIEDLTSGIIDVDIVISSVTSPVYVLTYEDVKKILKQRKGKQLFIIDIAVPRNIDPRVIALDDTFLFNIDDLKRIADDNLQNRLNEITLAEEIIKQSVADFMQWYRELELVPMITTIKNKFDEVRLQELNRYRKKRLKNLTDEDFKAVEELTKQIMTKTLHNPIQAIKQLQSSALQECHDRHALREKTRLIKELFKHEDEA